MPESFTPNAADPGPPSVPSGTASHDCPDASAAADAHAALATVHRPLIEILVLIKGILLVRPRMYGYWYRLIRAAKRKFANALAYASRL
jgi:hypothetical protein